MQKKQTFSEYQYYEFKSTDKPLTEKDREEISKWSSRTKATRNGAIFVYNYGDFPKDEIEVLKKHFDALFYISNWGTIWLAFKFPSAIADIEQIMRYKIPESIEIISGDYRCLYLMWLNLVTKDFINDWGNINPNVKEPPIPYGLTH